MPTHKPFVTFDTDLIEIYRGYKYVVELYEYGARAFVIQHGVFLVQTRWKRSQTLAEGWAQSYINERRLAYR